MFARLTTHPIRRSLELHRSCARAFHNVNAGCSVVGSQTRDVTLDSATLATKSSSKTVLTNQANLACDDNVDIMMEAIFQRAVPVPHAGASVSVGGKFVEDILNFPSMPAVYNPSSLDEELQFMNRNARRPKKANKGARPCSRASRRKKKEKIGNRSR